MLDDRVEKEKVLFSNLIKQDEVVSIIENELSAQNLTRAIQNKLCIVVF